MNHYIAWMRDPIDPREPRIVWDHEGSPYLPPRDAVPRHVVFRDHDCARCGSGTRACVSGDPRRCDWPRARND